VEKVLVLEIEHGNFASLAAASKESREILHGVFRKNDIRLSSDELTQKGIKASFICDIEDLVPVYHRRVRREHLPEDRGAGSYTTDENDAARRIRSHIRRLR
jgi:hypothetical protein